jgi:putative transposase
MNDIHSLSHTKWNCKYHIVFAPKYRRKVFYGEKRAEIGAILRELCNWKGVNIINAEVCPDHVHMLVEILPKMSVSGFMGFLKGKSSLMIYEKFGNMKFKYRNREF